MNTPNILTLLRIALVPVFIIAFYLPVAWSNVLATVIFGLAAITDWFDGYLARRYQQTTAFGAFLDPVADKLIVTVALVLLVQKSGSAWLAIPAAIIIGREIVISALREWMAARGKSSAVAVSYIGKVKTTAQMFALGFLLYYKPFYGLPTYETGLALMYVAAFFTLWSMWTYLAAALPVLLKEEM